MLAVVVYIDSSMDVYDTYYNRTILERTVTNALSSEFIQKVICVSPISERRRVIGGGLIKAGLRTDFVCSLRRKPLVYFGDVNDSKVEMLYNAVIKHEIDDIILLDANCPIVEPWLINSMAKKMLSEKGNFKLLGFNEGLSLTGITFLSLVESVLDKDNSGLDDLEYTNIMNEGDLFVEECSHSFRYNKNSSGVIFDFIFSEIDKGADINDLIGDINAK